MDTKMKSLKHYPALIILLLFIACSGCAHVISSDLRAQADVALTFSEVFKNPERYKGKIVVWGGEIIQTINQKDGTTIIEILQLQLDWEEEPKTDGPSGGRFLIQLNTFIDPHIYSQGREITVAGEILGSQTRAIGELQYRYPLLQCKQMYLWRTYYYRYPLDYYYPYYPFYPWPYYGYGPWGYYYYPYYPYPYGGRFGEHHDEHHEGHGSDGRGSGSSGHRR